MRHPLTYPKRLALATLLASLGGCGGGEDVSSPTPRSMVVGANGVREDSPRTTT